LGAGASGKRWEDCHLVAVVERQGESVRAARDGATVDQHRNAGPQPFFCAEHAKSELLTARRRERIEQRPDRII
jgi:hypothetical protein